MQDDSEAGGVGSLGRAELDTVATVADFGRALTRLRAGAGLSIRGVAERSQVSLSTLSGYFAGTHLPGPAHAAKLRRVLAVCGVTDGPEMDRWHEAWIRLRHEGGGPRPVAEPAAPTTLPTPAASVGLVGPRAAEAVRPVARPARHVLPSIRPPLERLAREPRVRGRDALVGRLADALRPGASPRVHVLHGLAGVGKSTVALAVAGLAQGRGARVWWAGARTADATADAMYALAAELGASRQQLEHASLPDLVWRLLGAQRGPWLLVFDGADDTDTVLAPGSGPAADGTGWVRAAPTGQGTVLLTTSDGHTWLGARSSVSARRGWFTTHRVHPLDSGDAARVLRELAPDAGDAAEAEALARRLGGLPLGLRLVGGALAAAARVPAGFADQATPRTFAAYAAALDGGALGGSGAWPGFEGTGVGWRVALAQLERRGHFAARPLLHLLACLAPGPVSWAALLRPHLLAASPLFPGLTALGLCEVLDALTDVGLVTRYREQPDELVEVPPLVRRCFRDAPEVRGQLDAHVALLTALLVAAGGQRDGRDPQSWPGLEALAGQERAALDLLADADASGLVRLPDQLLAPVLLAGRHRRAAGRLRDAERMLAQGLADGRRLLGRDHADVLALEHELGRVRLGRGDAERAERELRAVLDARVRLLGPDHPDTLTTQHYLGRALVERGRLPEAHAWFSRTLRARERVLGPAHRDTLTSRNNIGLVLVEQRRYDEARTVLEQVLAERVAALGDGHPATLVTRQHLARLTADTRGAGPGREAYRALLADCRRVLGPDHPRTAAARAALTALSPPQE
ncbi:tetratricopeptide repeat protein, partial [Streptacidiphilus jiangxiensis]|uniref:Tetratricopeptide repeat-containing protein n=1 Tax=Streptacidiphilus jiangxiensis TaxID=235985 RepID=A0A1H7WJ26_STRJI